MRMMIPPIFLSMTAFAESPASKLLYVSLRVFAIRTAMK